MSPSPAPGNSGQKGFEDPLESVAVIKTFKEIKKFIKTRKAILNGEPLYLRTQDQLKEQNLMGPWAFNATQSIIDSIPGMCMSALLWVVFAADTTPLRTVQDPITAKIVSVISPLEGPFSLLMLVYATAFACLPAGYTNLGNWHSAARKYLYFDAAYGLWPQLVLATCIALFSIPSPTHLRHPSMMVVAGVGTLGFLLCALWQGIITVTKVRAELFESDYLNDRPDMFVILEAPSLKFYAITVLGLPFLLSIIATLFGVVAVLLTRIVHLLRV